MITSDKKKIAAVTMVRNEDFFLRKWVEYYGACLGRENLFVLFDGEDQNVPSFCDGVNVRKFPHVEAPVQQGDRLRMEKISALACRLMPDFDAVIGTDADEYLAVDPRIGETLPQFVSRTAAEHPDWVSVSGLGMDVGQDMNCEKSLEGGLPLLSQRSKAVISTRYSKASVLFKPVRWGRGFHRVKEYGYHIVNDLYLFHFGGADISRIHAKMNDRSLKAEGWSRHLGKRARTSALCTYAHPFKWDSAVSLARRVQNAVHPPYAWNKPAMFELRPVVLIPERFRNTV